MSVAPTLPTVPFHRRAAVVVNEPVATQTRRLRILAPEIAAAIRPGQFVMFRLAGFNDPLIGRPLAVWETFDGADGRPEALEVLYLVKGKFTSRLATMPPGTELEVWGPLGNGFVASAASHLICVAGGIGQTPFLAAGREHLGTKRYGLAATWSGDSPARPATEAARRVTVLYGARSADRHAGVDDFRAAGFDVQLATDDGSAGFSGRVTDLLDQVLSQAGGSPSPAEAGHHAPPVEVLICGPEPMMEAASAVCSQHGVAARVSLETPMACGVGICFTCVARIRDADGTVDYRRTCVEGPVFPAETVVWT